MENTQTTEIEEGHLWIENPQWKCEIDGKEIGLGLMCEALDLREIDTEYDQEPYPVVVETQIVVAPRDIHPDFSEKSLNDGEAVDTPENRVFEAYRYSGGVPVNMEGIQGKQSGSYNDNELRTRAHATHGHEIKVRHFRTVEDAISYCKAIYANNAIALFGLVGFYLDKQINRAGHDGWSVIASQALNEERDFRGAKA